MHGEHCCGGLFITSGFLLWDPGFCYSSGFAPLRSGDEAAKGISPPEKLRQSARDGHASLGLSWTEREVKGERIGLKEGKIEAPPPIPAVAQWLGQSP